MPIVAATRSIGVQGISWLLCPPFLHLGEVVVENLSLGSEMGSSLSHLLKARTAREVGLFCAIHGLTVVLATNREDGSKLGGAGGAGL